MAKNKEETLCKSVNMDFFSIIEGLYQQIEALKEENA